MRTDGLRMLSGLDLPAFWASGARTGTALLFVSLTLSTGCVKPRYQTFKYYDQPTDTAALKEFAECIKPLARDQEYCQQGADMKAMQCETRAELEQMKCEKSAAEAYSKCTEDPDAICVERSCIKADCDPDYSMCVNTYDLGYSACGGKVRNETQCVKNCDKI